MEVRQKESVCQVVLHLSREEADALLNLLLGAPPTEEVPEEMTSTLLRHLIEAQRAPRLASTIESGHEIRNAALPG